MRHGHDESSAASASPALDERGEHLRHRAERSRREIGDLDRRQPEDRVLERSGPAEVVDVVRRAVDMVALVPEPGDGAVDGGLRHIVRYHASLSATGTEDFENTSACRTEPARSSVRGQVAHDGLTPRSQRGVQEVAVGRMGPAGGSTRTTRAPSRRSSRSRRRPAGIA